MDAVTFQAEVQRIERLLYRVAWSYLQNSQDAEDAVQEALVKAWEKRSTLRSIEQFKPWLVRILHNRCKDMLRKRRRVSLYPLEEDTVLEEAPQPPGAVMEAVSRLRPELRVLMTLYYVDGYSIQDLADTLRIPTGTVKSRMRNARKQLSQTLLIEWEEM